MKNKRKGGQSQTTSGAWKSGKGGKGGKGGGESGGGGGGGGGISLSEGSSSSGAEPLAKRSATANSALSSSPTIAAAVMKVSNNRTTESFQRSRLPSSETAAVVSTHGMNARFEFNRISKLLFYSFVFRLTKRRAHITRGF
jgi:hypothetical protein